METDSESLHRLVKVLADSGEAPTLDAAFEAFARYGVRIRLQSPMAPTTQVIALTAINVAARSFLGNVIVEGPLDDKLTIHGFEGTTLRGFLKWAGVSEGPFKHSETWPVIAPAGGTSPSEIRAWADGWAFGIGNGGNCTDQVYPPACVAAAGLALNEAFSLLRRDNPYAGHRSITISLWNLGGGGNPMRGPQGVATAPGMFMTGLGHLGQAYAWTLGFMKPDAGSLLILQDVDAISKSTLSTSLLSTPTDVGMRKTRIAAAWLESRGYRTAIVERRFDADQRVAAGEPIIALMGVDNPAARQVVEGAGFSLVVDAGLGSGYRDFRGLRVRTFPGPSKAMDIWSAPAGTDVPDAPAYRDMLARGEDSCGVTTLATRAVGASFVGCVAAGFALSEIFRVGLLGGRHSFIDVDLRDPGKIDFEKINGRDTDTIAA